jgi:4-amino-4-deoxy-L-arabinose transferase-like glycosyltransferase
VESAPSTDPWARRLAWFTLAFALLVLLLRFAFVASKSLTYDEATYAELADHPWRSSYYPDEIFARHPPLYFLVLAGFKMILGASETVLRLPGFLFSTATVLVLWATVRQRAGDRAAVLAGFVLGTSFLLIVYGLQVTMYAQAALLAAVALRAHLRGDQRAEDVALSLLAFTHLFGFVFIGLRLWIRRRHAFREATRFALPLAWLAVSSLAVLAVRNEPGPGLGPMWQAARTFELFWQLLVDAQGAIHHAFTFLLALLLLNPVLLERSWFASDLARHWRLGLALLVAFLFTGPAFLRFGLILLPAALILGLTTELPRLRRIGFLTATIALAGLVGATAFVTSGLDTSVQNDVPGLVDWREAADVFADSNGTVIAVAAPPPMAYYLQTRHGFAVADSSRAPDTIPMGRDDRNVTVQLAITGEDFLREGEDGALLLVTETSTGTLATLFQQDYHVCGRVQGALLLHQDPLGEGCRGRAASVGPP